MSYIFSDLYEMKRLNKWESQRSNYTKIILCETTLIQLEKDLYRRIIKERFVKTFCVN